jgi:phage shock protein PspC (stress-responsive transcriptional regulator)
MVSGVCGGIAEYFSVDETIVRLGVALVTAVTGIVPGLVFYFVAAVIMPENPA